MAKLKSKHCETYERLFTVIYFTATKGRPFTNFLDFLKLEKHHGVELFENGKHENELTHELYSVCFTISFAENFKHKLQRSKFVAAICDGSADSDLLEKECINISFVDTDFFVDQLWSNFSIFCIERSATTGCA